MKWRRPDSDTVNLGRLMVAIVACATGIAALIIGLPRVQPLLEPTSTPLSTAPPTETPTATPILDPTGTSTLTPPPTSTPTASPTPSLRPSSTPMPSPTNTVTPQGDCPPDARCYDVDFTKLSELDPSLWCEIPPDAELSQDGLVIRAQDLSPQLSPCPQYKRSLKYVEVTLSVTQTSGPLGYGRAGIEASLPTGYFGFKSETAGDAYIYHQLQGDESGTQGPTVPLEAVGQPHTLQVEWTGQSIVFSLDGSRIDYELASVGWGEWFNVIAATEPGTSVKATLRRLRWQVTLAPEPTVVPSPEATPTLAPVQPSSVLTIDNFEAGVGAWQPVSGAALEGGQPLNVAAQTTNAPQGQAAMRWETNDIDWGVLENFRSFDVRACRDIRLWGKGSGRSTIVVEMRCPDQGNRFEWIMPIPLPLAWEELEAQLPSTASSGAFFRNGNPDLSNCHLALANSSDDWYEFDDIRLTGCTESP